MIKSKKAMALALIGALMVLPACGQNSAKPGDSAQEEQADVLDLTGSWEAEEHGSDYYLAGYVKDGLIELHWVSDATGVGSVYWAGTYKASEHYQDPYSWTSKRDGAIMSTSSYAASEEERTFTYADGKLTLEASDQSGSYAVTLVRSAVDYTAYATEVTDEQRAAAEEDAKAEEEVDEAQAAADEKTKNAKVTDSGYSVKKIDGGSSLIYYAVEITNPNKYNAIKEPIIKISVRDDKGGLISKQQKKLAGIRAKETITFGDVIKCDNASPSDVEITVENSDYNIVPNATAGVSSVDDLKVLKTSKEDVDGRAIFKGTIKNTTDVDKADVIVSIVVKRDGEIVGGTTDFIDAIPAGDEVEFETRSRSDFSDYDEYEVYVTQEG